MIWFRGATAYEAQIWRVCFRWPFLEYIRLGIMPKIYLAPRDEE